MSHHYANLSNINGQKTGDNTFGNSKLDNKGQTINKDNNELQKFSDQNLFDDLSQAANYQSSKSALDGYSGMGQRNQGHMMNKTL